MPLTTIPKRNDTYKKLYKSYVVRHTLINLVCTVACPGSCALWRALVRVHCGVPWFVCSAMCYVLGPV